MPTAQRCGTKLSTQKVVHLSYLQGYLGPKQISAQDRPEWVFPKSCIDHRLLQFFCEFAELRVVRGMTKCSINADEKRHSLLLPSVLAIPPNRERMT